MSESILSQLPPKIYGGKVHELKVLPQFWSAIESGEKTFELRFDDRAYRSGDILFLREWSSPDGYTGKQGEFLVTYLVAGLPWLAKDHVCMAIKPLPPNASTEAQNS